MPTAANIAASIHCPVPNVDRHWPIILHALLEEGISDELTQVAALATVAVETGRFQPISERGTPVYFEDHYGYMTKVGRRLGNMSAGDGVKYCGRGFIQITGRANYKIYGALTGEPLEAQPDRALDPNVAAKILALYFSKNHIPEKAARRDWVSVRKAVNGGVNGLDPFLGHVDRLLALFNLGAPAPTQGETK